MPVSFSLTEAERTLLGAIAVNAIAERLAGRKPEAPRLEDCPESVRRNLGCFVTLHEKGALRGCIGSIVGREPLARNVWRMAQAAAFEDPRLALDAARAPSAVPLPFVLPVTILIPPFCGTGPRYSPQGYRTPRCSNTCSSVSRKPSAIPR